MATTSNSPHILRGTIYNSYNLPLDKVKVKAYDKDLGTEQLLGEAITDKNGTFLIKYTSAKFKRSEVKLADVFIRVFENTGRNPKELGASEIYFNVPKEFELNFKIDGNPVGELPEFTHLLNAIEPSVKKDLKIVFC